MKRFDYVKPASVAEALAAWEPGAMYLGGGTNLVDLMKVGVMTPDRVIDVTGIAGLDRIETTGAGDTRVGAMVRNSDLAYDDGFARRFPAVAEALLAGASGQLRNMATVGGNLMQRTRCAYFQDTDAACNRREAGSGCDARGGVADAHAILGWSEACTATHPSDFCVPLAAAGAVVEAEGPDGVRDIPFMDFHNLPGDDPSDEFGLRPGEIVVAVRLPKDAEAFAGHARYLKVRDRTSYAFAMVSAAAMLRMEGDAIAEGTIALGVVAAKPWRVAEAEALMAGQAPSKALFGKVADALLEGAKPSGDNQWKIDLARRVAVRALMMAASGTPERMPALPASVFGEMAHA